MSRTLLDEIAEARSTQAAGQIGRARACARRAVGMAIGQTMGIGPGLQNYAASYVEAARRLSADETFPPEVRSAAMRPRRPLKKRSNQRLRASGSGCGNYFETFQNQN